MIARIAVAFALCLAALPALAQDDGQILFNNSCRTCHSVKEGDNRLGPNLHGIVGRKSGALTNYGYSHAMANADVVWDKATLDKFIANPEGVVDGLAKAVVRDRHHGDAVVICNIERAQMREQVCGGFDQIAGY